MLFPDVKNFDEVFNEYYSMLVAFTNKSISDLDTSEDLVQDLFIYLFENRNKIEINGSIKSYLFQAVFNKCKSHQRKLITIEKYESQLKEEDFNEYRDTLVTTEFEAQLHQAIKRLPTRCQEIFTLSRFDDKSNDEIALQLGISKRTVETQISKAIKVLRKKISPENFFMIFL